jgi:hypothetical protein
VEALGLRSEYPGSTGRHFLQADPYVLLAVRVG